jgi:hypothetical protein
VSHFTVRVGSERRNIGVACVPPFEIIGLCGVALLFLAVMFGAGQTPIR